MEPKRHHPMIWLLGGDKGGVGKSTMAAMLAATLAGLGRLVTLIDTDTHTRDVSQWLATRLRDWPNLPRIVGELETENVGDRACEARDRGHDVVLDVGGRDAEQLRVAMSVADVLIMPIEPAQFDLFSAKRMTKRVAECRRWNPKLRAFFFINCAETNASLKHINEDAHAVCAGFAPVVLTTDVVVRRLVGFKYAARDGLGILEGERDNPAAREFWALLLEIEPSLGHKEEDVSASTQTVSA